MANKKDNNDSVKVFKEVNGKLETVYEGYEDVDVYTKTEKQNEDDIKRIDAYKQKNKRINEIKKLTDKLGPFYHFKYDYNDKLFEELENQKEPYLTYLSRYSILSDYVMNPKSRRKYYKKDLPDIFETNITKSNATYKLFLELELIKLDKNGAIIMNEEIMKVGGGFKTKYPTTYTRIFCEPGIKLYEGLAPKQKKYYGMLRAILPYVNFTHNILCANPTETDIDKLEVLNWKDICDIVGYNKKNSARLSKDLLNLKIDWQDVFMAHIKSSGIAITINPSLYYAGNNPEDLDYLFKLFKIDFSKKDK